MLVQQMQGVNPAFPVPRTPKNEVAAALTCEGIHVSLKHQQLPLCISACLAAHWASGHDLLEGLGGSLVHVGCVQGQSCYKAGGVALLDSPQDSDALSISECQLHVSLQDLHACQLSAYC